jgi:hypothetical protein
MDESRNLFERDTQVYMGLALQQVESKLQRPDDARKRLSAPRSARLPKHTQREVQQDNPSWG